MPLTAEQLTALDALQGVDPQELADAFHDKHDKAAQVLIDKGNAAASKTSGSELRKIEKRLEAEQQAREKAEAKLAEADPAKVHQQYQTEIRTKDEQYAKEKAELKATAKSREKARDLAELKARLAPKLKPMALRSIINDPATAAQLDYDDEGTRTIKQRGKDIPYSPPAGKDPMDLWAADLVEQVKEEDPDSVLVSAVAGGGSGGGSGAGVGGKTREQVIAEKKASGVY